MKPHRQGLIQCVAVNHVGKAVASTELCVFCVPRFASEFFILCFVFHVLFASEFFFSVLCVLCSVFRDLLVSEVSKWEYERHRKMQQQVHEHGDW